MWNWSTNKFYQGYNGNNYQSKRRALVFVAKHNNNIINNNIIVAPNSFTLIFESERKIIGNNIRNGYIILDHLDTDSAIIKYASLYKNYNIFALNFANEFTPCGGYERGAIAQEEDLCRQYPFLSKDLKNLKKNGNYPLNLGKIFISVNIPRHRENSTYGYKPIINPTINANFISSAAPNMNTKENRNKNFEHFEKNIKKSLDLIFSAPLQLYSDNCKILIIGAWGCGAFAPNIIYDQQKHVTYIEKMAKIIVEYVFKYQYYYDLISISIPDTGSENYQIFEKVLRNYNNKN